MGQFKRLGMCTQKSPHKLDKNPVYSFFSSLNLTILVLILSAMANVASVVVITVLLTFLPRPKPQTASAAHQNRTEGEDEETPGLLEWKQWIPVVLVGFLGVIPTIHCPFTFKTPTRNWISVKQNQEISHVACWV